MWASCRRSWCPLSFTGPRVRDAEAGAEAGTGGYAGMKLNIATKASQQIERRSVVTAALSSSNLWRVKIIWLLLHFRLLNLKQDASHGPHSQESYGEVIWEREVLLSSHNTQGSLEECSTDISESAHTHQTDPHLLHSMLGDDTTSTKRSSLKIFPCSLADMSQVPILSSKSVSFLTISTTLVQQSPLPVTLLQWHDGAILVANRKPLFNHLPHCLLSRLSKIQMSWPPQSHLMSPYIIEDEVSM